MAWRAISEHIRTATGQDFSPGDPSAVGGGCINQAFRLADAHQAYFVKTNTAQRLAMFEAEADALQALGRCGAIRVPRPVCVGSTGGTSYLVTDFVAMGHAGRDGWRAAGSALAALHRCTATTFGWHRDNTIGATRQINDRGPDWVDFWCRHRLGFQLAEAARNGYHGRLQSLGEHLLERVPLLLDHHPQASLLHGDLWGGNISFTQDGSAPVIFDPATYYGDREADLAMTELFGGFGADFRAAYEAAWPLAPGYPVRRTLYNLYHVLNHLNLFGGGYGAQAEQMMQRLLAEC